MGIDFATSILTNAHSRLTAYASYQNSDTALARRAWQEFYADDSGLGADRWTFKRETIRDADSLNPVLETPWLNTNDVSQWGLAAIQNLAMIGQHLPTDDPRSRP